MSSYKTPPGFISEAKSYSQWTTEIDVWNDVTDVALEKRGMVVALSLSITDDLHKLNIRERVFNDIDMSKLKSNTGVGELIKFLNDIYQKDDLTGAYESWREFDQCKRLSNQSIGEYISTYTRLYNKIKKLKMVLASSVLAFKLLDFSGLSSQDKTIVLTGVNYSEADKLFDQMVKSLKKFFGAQSISEVSTATSAAVKVEPVFQTEEAFYGSYRGRGKFRGGRFGNNHGARPDENKQKIGGKNPIDANGRQMTCNICQSINHFARACPDKPSKTVFEASNEDEEGVVFYSGETELNGLVRETLGCAVIDSACSATVCGEVWLKCYIDSLSSKRCSEVRNYETSKVFKFGSGNKIKSMKRVEIPCEIAGKICRISTEVVDSDIPLLLGKPSLKRAGEVLDLINDQATIFGQMTTLQVTESGHYFIPILPNRDKNNVINEAFLSIAGENHNHKRKVAEKLHKQFGHPSSERLKALVKKAGNEDTELAKTIDDISKSCDICFRFKKTPPKPVVAMPIAQDFNDAVAMDLKIWDKLNCIYILYLIDVATRYTKAAVIYSKCQNTIADNIIMTWIANGPGSPKRFLSDNGGEFSNVTYQEMCENFNIQECKTAVESPWSNGMCERNHAIVDDMVHKILEDDPTCSLEIALAWACHSKNCLQMVGGYSPFQLVFGKNPNIPNISSDKAPALEGVTQSEVLARHLNTLHNSRKLFIEAETSAKIRLALKKQIRSSGNDCVDGDIVYYKREKDERWKGPGKVIARDGKVVMIQHGNASVRVHDSRVVKKSNDLNVKNTISSEENLEKQACSTSDTIVLQESSDDDSPPVQHTDKLESSVYSGGIPKIRTFVTYKPYNEISWKTAKVTSKAVVG